MSATEWTALIVAAIGALGAVLLQGLQMYFSYRRDMAIKKDVSENTTITRAGTTAATINAKTAAIAAAESKVATQSMAVSLEKKLNGGIDAAVAQAVEPIQKLLDDHTGKIEKLNEYVHRNNHNVLDILQTQNTKLELILKKLEGK